MIHYGISGHLQALANVFENDASKVSLQKKRINKHKK